MVFMEGLGFGFTTATSKTTNELDLQAQGKER